jgi:hypothetical protein
LLGIVRVFVLDLNLIGRAMVSAHIILTVFHFTFDPLVGMIHFCRFHADASFLQEIKQPEQICCGRKERPFLVRGCFSSRLLFEAAHEFMQRVQPLIFPIAALYACIAFFAF